jgi:hypothetical protein
VVTYCAYRGLSSYGFIGVGWLLHTGWDALHHLYENPGSARGFYYRSPTGAPDGSGRRLPPRAALGLCGVLADADDPASPYGALVQEGLLGRVGVLAS